MKSLWTALAGLATAVAGLFRPSQPQNPPPPKPPGPGWVPPTNPGPDATVAELLRAHNDQRFRNGATPLPGLVLNESLNRAAQGHAAWMARNRQMNHRQTPNTPGYTGTTFGDRASREGYQARKGGENVAAGQRDVEEVMDAWMHSPGHRQNILDPAYWHVGFGVARDDFGHLYWCTVFGTPLMASARAAGHVECVTHLPPPLVRHPF